MNATRGRLVRQLFGLFPVQVMHALVQLGIPEHLTKEPCSLPDLADAIGAEQASLRRLLRAASSLGLVQHAADGTIALTDDGSYLQGDTPGSIRNLVLLWGGEEGWRSWGRLAYSVRTGDTAYEHLFGRTMFDQLDRNPDQQTIFNHAMAESCRAAAPGIAEACRLGDRKEFVDVGGGSGILLSVLLAANPELRGVLFDRPVAVSDAQLVFEDEGLAGRCRVIGGNFFEAVPPGGDAYLLKSVLHDWNDDECVSILANCRAAMGPDAVLYIVEPLMPTGDAELAQAVVTVISDLNMLVCTGGVERTEDEFRGMLQEAGFHLADATLCKPPSNLGVLRATPIA